MTKNSSRVLAGMAGAVSLLSLSSPSFALGIPDPWQYDMDWMGTWTVAGGISGFGAVWNNNVPNAASTGEKGGVSGDVSIDNALAIINKTDGQLQFTVWAGVPPQTPVMGYNSPGVGPNLSAFGNPVRNGFAHNDWLFKGYATYQPLSWFSVQAGRLPSPDGTEIGVDWLNPTVFLSDLNNMQTTTANGGQVNFIAPGDTAFFDGFIPGYGSTLTIRLADGYKANNVNELGFTGLWNLNPDGSDYVVGFGHTRLSPAGSLAFAGHVAGFGTVNSDLIGVGGQYVLGQLTFIPQMQYQWLPRDIISGANAPKAQYSEASGELTVAYQLDQRWSLAGQVQYISQQGASTATDPNANIYGNYLDLSNGGPGSGFAGTFGPQANMLGLQFNPTWQFHNFFVRPSVAWTHLSDFPRSGGGLPGGGYGKTGDKADQFVGLLEVGFLFGQRAD